VQILAIFIFGGDNTNYMIFIKIKVERKPTGESYIKRILTNIIGLVIPKANPDFENKIKLVAFWLLEFEDENSIPVREIGIADDGQTILKMPYGRNYGYWTDNNLNYHDFSKLFFKESVTKQFFEEKWSEL
jgi:hypothetical protein